MSFHNEIRRAGDAAGLDRNWSSQDNLNNNQRAKFPQAQNAARLRFLAAQLHALGPKPLFHFLDELERGADLRISLERYSRLPAEFILAYGGRDFPPSAFAIRGGGR
jgi:hypothetical protein